MFFANHIIDQHSKNKVYSDVNLIPHKKVGLLLGTEKYLNSGDINPYFQYRINSATELYKANKIEYIVASGDNSTHDYNEPLEMQNSLFELGVPRERVYLDFAGFRTYDSVVRMNEIFGQDDFVIISQEFHNKRAIYIADQLNLKAIGYNAKDVNPISGFKTNMREYLARVNVFWDILIGKNPKFLGEKIKIP